MLDFVFLLLYTLFKYIYGALNQLPHENNIHRKVVGRECSFTFYAKLLYRL
jgi:hypothetical protein